ncbi:MAG: L-glyceraldehyde 3-phosphate reductase [Phycisphaerae bacterium]|nr:L-glyceraldehyde 3-phosphate reductase [Phycisphaerae bacterium]
MVYQADKNRYETMQYNRCGRSGLKLPAVSLGLWHNFGGVDTLENSRAMLYRAFDLGITHFDLANNYGPPPGSAEETFGQILKDDFLSYRDEIVISTKAGYLMWDGPYGEWGSRKYLMASLEQSLKRMGMDYVDIFYSHRLDPDTPLEETMGALASAVKQGKALYAGISNYPAKETAQAADILKSMGVPCLIHQAKYSMLNRWIEDDLLDTLEDKQMGCIVFSPLAQGLLTNKYLDHIPENSRAAKPHGFLQTNVITDQLRQQLNSLQEIATQRGQSLAQMALAWSMRDKRVTSVLIGASSVGQIEDNVAILDNMEFEKEELNRIEKILK